MWSQGNWMDLELEDRDWWLDNNHDEVREDNMRSINFETSKINIPNFCWQRGLKVELCQKLDGF
jgi:hypothetical protein